MRDKRRTRRRVVSDGKAAADEVGTADRVLAIEAGWGYPHVGVAILAAIVVGARAVAWQIGRIAAAVGCALRRRRG